MREVALLFALPACLAGCETLEAVRGGPVASAPARQEAAPPRRSAVPPAVVPDAEPPAPAPEALSPAIPVLVAASDAKPVEPVLTAAVYYFEEGNYGKAEALLRSSLQEGLGTRAQKTRAHKYLAFIYCITQRTAQCRREFAQALRTDPQFGLTAAEAGHPTWGPVFRAVKAGR